MPADPTAPAVRPIAARAGKMAAVAREPGPSRRIVAPTIPASVPAIAPPAAAASTRFAAAPAARLMRSRMSAAIADAGDGAPRRGTSPAFGTSHRVSRRIARARACAGPGWWSSRRRASSVPSAWSCSAASRRSSSPLILSLSATRRSISSSGVDAGVDERRPDLGRRDRGLICLDVDGGGKRIDSRAVKPCGCSAARASRLRACGGACGPPVSAPVG